MKLTHALPLNARPTARRYRLRDSDCMYPLLPANLIVRAMV